MRFAYAAFLLSCSGSAFAATLTLAPQRDTTLFEESGTLSNGAGPHSFVGTILTGAGRRALLRFDLSAISPGSSIQRVELSLNLSRTISGDLRIGVHRVNADWGEAGSNSGTPGGAGAPAQVGDATWTHRLFPNQTWAMAGGDFVLPPSGEFTAAGVRRYTIASTPGLVADVNAWVDSPAQNFGWLLRGDESVAPPSAKRFDSRENANPASRPQLLVEFTAPAVAVPVGGTLAGILLACALLLVVLRRSDARRDAGRRPAGDGIASGVRDERRTCISIGTPPRIL